MTSAVLMLILAACGGGGGGAATPVAPPGPAATGTINTGTVLVVAGRSVDAVFQSGGSGDITSFVGLTMVSSSGPGGAKSGIAAKPGEWIVRSQTPFGPETTGCTNNGFVTVSGDIASPLTVTAGDFLDYDFDNCDDGLGQMIDGLIRMTFTEFDGNLLAGQILLAVSLDVINLQVWSGGEQNTINGDLSLTIDSRTQPETIVTTLGNSLQVTNASGTDTLSGFSSTVIENTSMFPSEFTTDATGTVTSTLFNGFVTYDTFTELQSSGDGYPYAGEIVVFGDNNSTVRIIAMSDVDVRIEADYDGDGATDATIDTTWAALVDD